MNSKVSFIILFLSISISSILFPKDEIKVISSDRNSIVIEYTPDFTDTSRIVIKNQEYIRASIYSGRTADPMNWGMPSIPERSINIGVPAEFGNTIQVLNTTRKEISGNLLPLPKFSVKEQNQSIYEPKAEYHNYKDEGELVRFGVYGLLRDLPVQEIVVRPVEFDASQNKIKLYTKVLFRVNFSQNQQLAAGYSDELAEGTIINYDIARSWGKVKKTQGLKKATIINSVLSTGRWFRFEAPTEGMYRITRSMLASLGIDASGVDPRKIKIYNNGGKMIPENMNTARPADLNEVAIQVAGQEDGRFDEGDYILFYGRGINFWDVERPSNAIKRYFNLYSAKNYYWITASGEADGKRIAEKSGLNEVPQFTRTSSMGFADWEVDTFNIAHTGRVFVGDQLSPEVRTRQYTSQLNGRLDSQPVNYRISYIGATEKTSDSIKIYENNNLIISRLIPGYIVHSNGYEEHAKGWEYILNGSFGGNIPGNQSMLKFSFSPGAGNSLAYLNYFEMWYEKELRAFNDYLMFLSKNNTGITEYQLNGFSNTNIRVYDVSEYDNVKLITNHTMLSGGECRFRINENTSYLSKYIAVGNDNFLAPSNPVEIGNSNIHGIPDGVQYIIIAPKEFKEAAQRLKDYRQNEAKNKLSSVVVDVEQLFNEFGGGLRDPSAIRDFLKYAYDNWTIKPEYVFFFGNGSYDYKNIERANNNFIPTWQSDDSFLNLIESYPSDDFFLKVSGNDDRIDLAGGRITCRTAGEAALFAAKIIRYEAQEDPGLWRNLITLVSDDGLTNERDDGTIHTDGNEILSKNYIPGTFDIDKVYAAEYPIFLTSAGRRKPEAQEAIIKSINDGTVLLNYIGHGNPNVWAHEYIFERPVTIPRLTNDKYFFLSAGTCDFGLFDSPGERSSAEDMLFLPNAGTIGTYTATRPVFSSLNQRLIQDFFSSLFKLVDSTNLTPTIGYANFLTKQSNTQPNDQKYFIFGDPALRLNFPRYRAGIDSINGQQTAVPVNPVIQVKALSNTNIEGHIIKPDGSEWNDFNGEGILTVYDSERQVPLPQLGTLGKMSIQGGMLFRGKVSVTGGKFSGSFIVPKDISYENKRGKAVIYFYGTGIDGIGFTNLFSVGGTDSSTVNDGDGPEIEVFFDDMTFKDSYLINPNSTLIAAITDETGLNTTGSGVGHKLEGVINDKESEPIDFSNFFEGDLDSGGKSGKINYKFNNLDQGEYKLQLKAWDVFNNFSTETVYFSVVNSDELVLRDVYNYPNPFSSNTTFTFQQNINDAIDVKIKIYTIAGRLIKEIESNNLLEKFVKIDWDGRDQDGSEIANGTYLYKIIVKSTNGTYNNSVLGKLAVIR